ncbi:NAD dependent epimerase/dehydratase family protein [Colletotrichum eremochloae]|nr:NAD dependent epimerase/dehydratase family protein [Colletotrichum eremochloae]
MASAIVTGATGILGREIVDRLGQNPEQWKTVYAMSRSNRDKYPPNVKHGFVDLTRPADKIAKDLEGVEAEYVFFAAYVQKDSEKENWDANGDMLQNFLAALEKTGAADKVKRILLITGAKQYGVHLGVPPSNPMEDSDPWHREDPPLPPIFYERQRNILRSFCERHKNASWTVTYPNDVIGVAKGNFMNLATTLGLYAAITRELGRDLEFPGSETFYTKFDCFTSAKLHAEFCEWAVLEPRAANEAFNVVNGDVESWQNMWPRLARRFGLKIRPDQFAAKLEADGPTELIEKPPVGFLAERSGVVRKVEPSSRLEERMDLAKWSQQDIVKKAWDQLAEREGLVKDAFEKATWSYLGSVLGRNFDLVISMSKARERGWTGYTDTWQCLQDFFGQLETEKILPRIHGDARW